MDYISTSPFNCYKGLLNSVLKYTDIPEKKSLDICSIQNIHPLNRYTKNLLLILTNKNGRKITHPQFFDNEFLSSPKTIKIGLKYYVLPTKQYDICD